MYCVSMACYDYVELSGGTNFSLILSNVSKHLVNESYDSLSSEIANCFGGI